MSQPVDGLLFIPIGVLVYFIIRKLSDMNVGNKSITIADSSSQKSIDVKEFCGDEIQASLNLLKQRNDSNFVLKGLPVKLEEFRRSNLDNQEYIRNRLVGAGYSSIYKNLICSSEKPYQEVAVSALYENAVLDGTYKLPKNGAIASFLTSNRLIHIKDIDTASLQEYAHRGIKIILSSDSDNKRLETMQATYGVGNAMLLLLCLSGFVDVVKC